MSLEGAKLICLNDADGSHGRILPAHGKTFKFGYYMDSDIVLEHSDALGLHCTIDCDAFGRVTIENRCPEQPITLDGKVLKKMRPLLHNTEICILDKKYLWQFEGNTQAGGFQSEDANDFATPCKQMKKAEQPPMSEPARRWRTQYHKRLTIHNIKAGENSPAVEVPTDENKPFNTYERIISPVPFEQASKQPSSPLAADLIDLKTPNVRQKSFAPRKPPLSCCKLSETVITSYSPRETGVRPEKSFAIVQSPAATPKKSSVPSDISLGPFQHSSSPLPHNYRPSMHLIDLTTPLKRPPLSSPSSNVLKSALKKGTSRANPQPKPSGIAETSPASMDSTVYSVHSTDDSVIELSDEGSFSPSPVLKTPQRPRTPQSLMKRAILSSAKKAATTKRLQQPPKPPPPTPLTPKNPPSASAVRFQSQSTPQRKSLGRFPSPDERLKASQSVSGKGTKSMITSTPFRAGDSATTVSRRSSILRSPSTSLTGLKNKSRVSLMLTQALAKSPQTNASQRRKSVTFIEGTKSPCKSATKARKSVSFLDRIESEELEEKQTLNETFSLEGSQIDEEKTTTRKDATFSPEKDKTEAGGPSLPDNVFSGGTDKKSSDFEEPSQVTCSSTRSGLQPLNVTFSPKKDADSVAIRTTSTAQPNTEDPQSTGDELNRTTQSTSASPSTPQTPQSSRRQSNHTRSTPTTSAKQSTSEDDLRDIVEDDDFEGLDAIFKTPKARNLMILSSPKSIGLQKPTKDSVELVHSTEYDLSASLDAIFKTPHSELTSNPSQTLATPAEDAQPNTAEEAFDVLLGRPISRRNYTRKPSPKNKELSPLNVPKDPTLPRTDIEEWIENVNESVDLLDDEDELSYLTATTQGEFSRDPLMMSSLVGSVSTTNGKKRNKSLTDESAMTIQEDDEEDRLEDALALKDPLETTVQTPKRSLSPNISGIDLLDHTSESLFSETLAVSDESSGENQTEKTVSKRDQEETITDLNEDIQISPDKARREMERAFANFEAERRIVEGKRLVSTPELKKPVKKPSTRRTMGNQQTLHAFFDVKALKAEREMELAFEKFEESPKRLIGTRLAKTPELGKSKSTRRDTRKTLGNEVSLSGSFDLERAKAEREMELAFENFEEKPVFPAKRSVQTPEPKKMSQRDTRRTMGSNLASEVKLDVRAAKTQREMESAFENFEEEPTIRKERLVQTPHPKKGTLKDNRRSVGSSLVSEVKLDLKAAKAEREMEFAFENFEEEPEFSSNRVVKTPEPNKAVFKDHRRTMGSNLVSDVKLDLKAAKAEREMELAFENFEEEPEFSSNRVVKTPEPKKAPSKDHRRTMGSGLVSKVTIDLEAAKAEREMELAFENFEEEPEFAAERVVKTPETKKAPSKDHRRTMGSNLVSNVKLDLKAAKAEREMELAFENFEEEPEFSGERVVQTPEPKKAPSKDHRRTMGSALASKVTLDLEAAKAEREMELAFENFEEEPEFAAKRVAQTPEPKKVPSKDHRRTMGNALVSKVTLDLEAAKAEREMELAFENFEEEPEFAAERVVKTPEPKKAPSKDHRRTMGSGLVSKVTLDLEAAKAEREMELAFENFEEEPEFGAKRVAQTPEPKKVPSKDHRRTMGNALVSKVTIDLEAAKAEREMELAFENFEEKPEFSGERVVQTPEPKKAASKDHRRTMGSGLVSKVTLDLKAAKAEREMELAFENFEEEPEFAAERVAQTPEPKKAASKDHRRTMGSALVSKVTLDLEAAKAEREMELAFENFEEEPEFAAERVAQTPEPKKAASKDHRRTMGSGLVSKVTLDLEAAKAEREMELAFENFEEEPEFGAERVVQTPEPKKAASKDHRRTMGSNLVSDVKLDLKAAKAEREMELAFENFEEEPEFAAERVVKTPEPKKASSKDHRRTMGSALVSKVTLDLEAAKEEREMELAFENFEEEPEFSGERVVQTPEPKKAASKDHRRTMGSGLVSKVTLDLEAAKAEREMELAFENFEEEPEFAAERVAQTPEPKKAASKDHRRTMGSGLVSKVTLDLEAAKTEREMELAFENFEEEPEFSAERVVQTPEPKKAASKDHRRTMGSALVSKVTLDLEAAKAEREMELAFENFEEEPEFTAERVVQTPEPKKVPSKDHRRTMGNALVSKVTLDLEAAKAEREMELAFENFEEEPEFSSNRVVKTPEPKKAPSKDHRRTMGSALVSKVTLDLEAAKADREMELAFENFEEEPEFTAERVVQTPEPKKVPSKNHRRTMGNALVSKVTLDLEAAKAEREMELAFENFEEKPEFAAERVVQTPEPKKVPLKDRRRTMGSHLKSNVSLDLKTAKAQLELARERELAQHVEGKTVFQNETENDNLTPGSDETVESQSSSANEELQTADDMVTHEEHQEGVLYKDSNAERVTSSEIKSEAVLLTPMIDTASHPRFRRKRQNTVDTETKADAPSTPSNAVHRPRRGRRNTVDDDVKVENIVTSAVNDQTQETAIATPTISQPRSRRRRQNTIEALEQQQEGSTTTEVKTPQPTQTRKRTRRQNSVDVSSKETAEHHRTEEDHATDEKTSTDADPKLKDKDSETETSPLTSHGTRKRRKNSITEDDVSRNPAEGHAIPTDSTDDEIKHTPSTRTKRGRKVGSITTASSQIVDEVHHDLEPIIEEEKPTGTPATNQEVAPGDSAVVGEKMTEVPEAPQTRTKQNVGVSSNRRNKSTSEDEVHTMDAVSSQTEEEALDGPESVTEEVTKLEKPSKDQEAVEAATAKQASRPVRRRAGRNQAPEQEEKLINIKPELDEMITSSPMPSNTRTRGRRANLNVVLIESTNTSASSSLNVVQVAGKESADVDGNKSRTWQTLSVKLEPVEEMTLEAANSSTQDNGDQEIVSKMNGVPETDVDDVIASTPVPLKPRGRRLASKVESAESTAAPALRRGRRGSIQQDPKESVTSTPVPSKSRSRTAVIKVEPTEPTSVKSTPVRRRGRRGDDAEENAEEAIPSTPVPTKTRGRRALQKPETTECSSPPPKRGRRGAADPVKEVVPSAELDADIPPADDNIEDVVKAHNLPESSLESSTPDVVQPTPVTLKTRRRRASLKKEPTKPSAEEVTDVEVEGIPVVAESATADEPVKQYIDVQAEEVVLPKSRGRKAVQKVEPDAVIAETDVEDDGQMNEQPTKANKRGRARVNESVESSPAPETQVITKTRGRRAAIKAEPETSAAQSSTPARRGRRRGAVEDEQEVKEAAQSSEPMQVVEEKAAVEASTKEEHDVVADVPQTKVDELVPPIPIPSRQRGRKAALKAEPVEATAESSTPARKRARRGTVDTELHAQEVPVAASKTSDAVSSSETTTPARKRGRRPAVKEEPEDHTEDDNVEKVIPSKKRGRLGAIHSETPVERDSETHTEEDDVEKVIPSKRRGRAAASKAEVTETTAGNSTKRGQHTDELDSGAEKAVESKKRGRPQRLKLEPTDSASESSTPARKRGRRGAVPEDTHEANATDETTAVPEIVVAEVPEPEVVPVPTRGRRRPANQKVEPAVETKKRGRKATANLSVNQADDEKSEEDTTDSTPVNPEVDQKPSSNPTRSRRSSVKETKTEDQVQTTEVSTSEAKAQKKPIRSRRLLSTASPSYATSEAEQTHSAESEQKSEKKPTRGRRAAPKKDTNAESTSHTEEEQPASATKKKATRGRKAVVKADTSTEKEQSQAEDHKTTRGRKPSTKADPVEAEVITEDTPTPTKKPTRSRKAVQAKSKPAEEPEEPSPAPTKATRTRKAPVAKDTDDEQSHSEAPKKPTRSRKASQSAKDDDIPVSKRANLRNLEVSTDNDTPSKRMRRKPKMLLSDEFVH